jgi:endonuclease/exonuclease/phosphatase family metal-dependent hydrolase
MNNRMNNNMNRNLSANRRLAGAAFRLVCALAILAGLLRTVPALGATAQGPVFSAMTFNLRYASSSGPNAWPDRLPILRDCILESAPDLIGTQEGLYHQLKDLAQELPDYAWIGTGRDGGSRGEFMAIFYRPDRFEPLEFDHFWLSDTPNVVASTTWGNSNRRMVTWIKFRDLHSDVTFYFWNTHFDHEIQEARFKSAQLVLERVNALETNLPVLLVGDFNATAGANPAYDVLVHPGAFIDTWPAATTRRGEIVKTFHGFRGPTPGDGRIDWILMRGPVACIDTEILTYNRDGQYPSDHFPVIATLRWTAR